jgi:hypothetical protein
MSNPFNLDLVKSNFDELVKTDLPVRLANISRNFFAASWKKQGWDDGGVSPWAEVQRRMAPTKAFRYSKPAARTRAILVRSGFLRRAVMNSVEESTFNRIRLTVRATYAGYLNEGTDKMAAREFVGDSKTLSDMIENKIEQTVDKIWNK